MKQLEFEQSVMGRVATRPHLIPIFTNPLRIPEKLREANEAYFVVLNVSRILQKIQGLPYKEWTPIPQGVTPRYNAWYEVHKLNVPAYVQEGVILPFGPLDDRAIPYVTERDTELSGWTIFDRLDQANREREERLARDRRNLSSAIAEDMRTAVALDYWGRGNFGPVPLSQR